MSVYMPCDNYSKSLASPEYNDVINAIESTMHEHNCYAYVLCGDFNTSFSRDNAHCKCLRELMNRNHLCLAWDNPSSTCGNTYTNLSLNHFSCIDHFLLSTNLYELLCNSQIHYDATNPSNHNVISMKCKIETLRVDQINKCKGSSLNRCAWNKATDNDKCEYIIILDTMLGDICVPSSTVACSNPLCNDIEHKRSIDNFCSDIINCCIQAGKVSIPNKREFMNTIPGWENKVKPERDHSIFWHWIWLECGRPNTGHVYEIMKKSRHRYHYAVRLAKRDEFSMKKQKMAECISGSANFWRELKKINPRSRSIPTTVDGACGPDEIA